MKERLRALEAEREVLAQRLSRPRVVPDAEVLRARVTALAADLRRTVGGAPDECRRAFKLLLAGRRMRVRPDAERQFRVEGLFALPSTNEPPRVGRLDRVVAGACYDTVEPALLLPWAA